jgi:tetratricopeptide (TPR) repeat protein
MQEIGELMQKLRQDPGDVATLIQLAERFVQEKNWPPAENFARKAVVAAPGNPQPLYLLGVILHNQGNHAEAAACLERVVSLRDEPSVRYSLGVLYARYLQDPARGGQHLRAALAQPGLPDGLAETIRAELDVLASQATPSKETDAAAKTALEKKGVKPLPAR